MGNLADLEEKQFLRTVSLYPDLSYSFRHSLTHDVVYASLKAVAENSAKFKTFHPALAPFKPQAMAEHIGGFPLHDGARMFYRDQGILK